MSVIDKLLKFKTTAPDFCSAVVLAAGNSQRMGKDKILMPIGGAPVIAHTLKALQSSDRIDEIVIVTKYERAYRRSLIYAMNMESARPAESFEAAKQGLNRR